MKFCWVSPNWAQQLKINYPHCGETPYTIFMDFSILSGARYVGMTSFAPGKWLGWSSGEKNGSMWEASTDLQ